MRFTAITAAVALLLAPAALADLPPGDWSGETTVTVTSSYSTTMTITKTLTYAHNATTSIHPTGWNATSSTTKAASTVNKPSLTATSPVTSTTGVVIASATGAATVHEINLAVGALAAAAMVWGSL